METHHNKKLKQKNTGMMFFCFLSLSLPSCSLLEFQSQFHRKKFAMKKSTRNQRDACVGRGVRFSLSLSVVEGAVFVVVVRFVCVFFRPDRPHRRPTTVVRFRPVVFGTE
jgi:hypothetical protein